ncbi:MAG TPA: hypothetical protein DCR55_14305 [Lentisphaeria bacterium]|nr:hypothetical protein [Lentisphaeria bacterium]
MLDLMPMEQDVLGFSNRWYIDGWKSAIPMALPPELSIRIFRYPYFLTTKLEAFHDRGADDPRFSHDLEDIVLTLAARTDLPKDFEEIPPMLMAYLRNAIHGLMTKRRYREYITCNLPMHVAKDAFERLDRFFAMIVRTMTD